MAIGNHCLVCNKDFGVGGAYKDLFKESASSKRLKERVENILEETIGSENLHSSFMCYSCEKKVMKIEDCLRLITEFRKAYKKSQELNRKMITQVPLSPQKVLNILPTSGRSLLKRTRNQQQTILIFTTANETKSHSSASQPISGAGDIDNRGAPEESSGGQSTLMLDSSLMEVDRVPSQTLVTSSDLPTFTSDLDLSNTATPAKFIQISTSSASVASLQNINLRITKSMPSLSRHTPTPNTDNNDVITSSSSDLPPVIGSDVLPPEDSEPKASNKELDSTETTSTLLRHQCAECKKVFSSSSRLREHQLTHSSEKLYKCSLCGRTFTFRSSLHKHLRKHPGAKGDALSHHPLGSPDTPGSPGLLAHEEPSSSCEKQNVRNVRSKQGQLKCQVCSTQFKTTDELKQHCMIHSQERKFACELCPLTFTTQALLTNHMRSHSATRPFQCEQCHKTFRQAAALFNHQKIHSKDRPYTCTECGRAFKYKNSLKVHMNVHLRQSKYSCQVCGEKFMYRNTYLSHTAKHSGEKKYSCHICPAKFVHSFHFKKHIRTHKGHPAKCVKCEQMLKVHSSMDSQTGSQHKNQSACQSKSKGIPACPVHLPAKTQPTTIQDKQQQGDSLEDQGRDITSSQENSKVTQPEVADLTQGSTCSSYCSEPPGMTQLTRVGTRPPKTLFSGTDESVERDTPEVTPRTVQAHIGDVHFQFLNDHVYEEANIVSVSSPSPSEVIHKILPRVSQVGESPKVIKHPPSPAYSKGSSTNKNVSTMSTQQASSAASSLTSLTDAPSSDKALDMTISKDPLSPGVEPTGAATSDYIPVVADPNTADVVAVDMDFVTVAEGDSATLVVEDSTPADTGHIIAVIVDSDNARDASIEDNGLVGDTEPQSTSPVAEVVVDSSLTESAAVTQDGVQSDRGSAHMTVSDTHQTDVVVADVDRKRPHQCSQCSRRFARKGHLSSHMLSHTGETPFPCAECGARFRHLDSLEAHENKHKGIKPYVCTACGARFVGSGGLRSHLRRHSDQRPHACTSCSATFKTSGNLKKHQLTHQARARTRTKH